MLVLGTAPTLRGARSGATSGRSRRSGRSLLAVTTSGITGVLGQDWRADVTGWGAIEPWDGSATLSWHVAADDRWHSPDTEAAVRQVRVLGAPVFETRLRVPGR